MVISQLDEVIMQANEGVMTIEEGDGVKSRPITSHFWLKGGRYRVTIPDDGWEYATLDQCQVGEASKPASRTRLGPRGTTFFNLRQGFYRFALAGSIEKQPKSAEIARVAL